IPGAQQPTLRAEPVGELRIAIRLEAVCELAGEERHELTERVRRNLLDARLHRARHFGDVDEAACEIQRYRIAFGYDARAVGVIQHASQLAQAPAQLATRIVRSVPEQLAQATARNFAG